MRPRQVGTSGAGLGGRKTDAAVSLEDPPSTLSDSDRKARHGRLGSDGAERRAGGDSPALRPAPSDPSRAGLSDPSLLARIGRPAGIRRRLLARIGAARAAGRRAATVDSSPAACWRYELAEIAEIAEIAQRPLLLV